MNAHGRRRAGEGASELQRAELLVHGQDVMVEFGREQQVLQSPHVLLDGHVVLRDKGKRPGNIKEQQRRTRACGLEGCATRGCVCVCV